MTYEQLLEMLRDMHPDIDFETAEGLIDRKVLTSFDVVSIAAELSETYGVELGAVDRPSFRAASSCWWGPCS